MSEPKIARPEPCPKPGGPYVWRQCPEAGDVQPQCLGCLRNGTRMVITDEPAPSGRWYDAATVENLIEQLAAKHESSAAIFKSSDPMRFHHNAIAGFSRTELRAALAEQVQGETP